MKKSEYYFAILLLLLLLLELCLRNEINAVYLPAARRILHGKLYEGRKFDSVQWAQRVAMMSIMMRPK